MNFITKFRKGIEINTLDLRTNDKIIMYECDWRSYLVTCPICQKHPNNINFNYEAYLYWKTYDIKHSYRELRRFHKYYAFRYYGKLNKTTL